MSSAVQDVGSHEQPLLFKEQLSVTFDRLSLLYKEQTGKDCVEQSFTEVHSSRLGFFFLFASSKTKF